MADTVGLNPATAVLRPLADAADLNALTDASNKPENLVLADGVPKLITGGDYSAEWYGASPFGAFSVASASGATSESATIMEGINATPDGETYRIPPGVYRLTKLNSTQDVIYWNAGASVATTFATTHAKNDQSCVVLYKRRGLTIDARGCRFIVEEHGQGPFELKGCVGCTIIGGVYIGAGCDITGAYRTGGFVPLDGTTGRGEKGTATEGYYTTGYWSYYVNNSKDTSASTTHGNGGAAWGTFRSGWIGNMSVGIMLRGGCERCRIIEPECYGLTMGVAVGGNWEFINDAFAVLNGTSDAHGGDFGRYVEHADWTAVPVNKANTILRPVARLCYSAGVAVMNAEDTHIIEPDIADMGHPDATIATDDNVDPGYGVTERGTIFRPGLRTRVRGGIIADCNRKGLDSHSGYGFDAEGVKILRAGVGALHLLGSGITSTRGYRIHNVTVESSGYSASPACVVIQNGFDSSWSAAAIRADGIIEGLELLGCGGLSSSPIIHVRPFDNLRIQARIEDVHPEFAPGGGQHVANGVYGVTLGNAVDGANANTSYNLDADLKIKDTTGGLALGVQLFGVDSGRLKAQVDLSRTDTNNTGGGTMTGVFCASASDVDIAEARATLVHGRPLSLALNTGLMSGLRESGGNLDSVFPAASAGGGLSLGTTDKLSTEGNGAGLVREIGGTTLDVRACIIMEVTLNGTSSPTHTVSQGASFVSAVNTLAQGFQVVFTGLPTTATPLCIPIRAAQAIPTTGGTDVTYTYNRASSYTQVQVGCVNDADTHIDGSTITGVYDLMIFV